MKDLKDIIVEKLRINKDTKAVKQEYTCQPKDFDELRSIIEEQLSKDKDADLNDIDVSQIRDMSYLFEGLYPHNIKIDKWDVSNVKDMSYMFCYCKNFEGKGLENWNVSKVQDFNKTFYYCKRFNGDLSKWDVSNANDMYYMFAFCENFNCDLSKWDVSNVKNMRDMFNACINFEGKGLENWNISNNVDMGYAFFKCNSLKKKPSWYTGTII